MLVEQEGERQSVRAAIALALKEVDAFLPTRKELDLEKNTALALTVSLGDTLEAILQVLRGLRTNLPTHLPFDQTTVEIITNHVDSIVPAWNIRSEMHADLTSLAKEHQVYLESLHGNPEAAELR